MKCPGQDSRYWEPGAIFEEKCPQCGHTVEFFKDESSRRCRNCGHKFVNPRMDFGCASYCKFAEQCLGDLPPELIAKREDLLKDRVAIEMKKYFHKDFKSIAHATKVARYAEQLVRQEGGDPAIVLLAGYLHGIGFKEAQRKYGSSAADYREQEGPPIARAILERLGARQELIDEVCDIIGHQQHPREGESTNFKVLYDANLIANLEEDHKNRPVDREKLRELLDKSFYTDAGKQLAAKVLLETTE